MSRIGKYPVPVPRGVTVEIKGREILARGKAGELRLALADEVAATLDGDRVSITPRGESAHAREMWGTTRSLLRNMVQGVAEGYSRNLEINGVGYRAQVQGTDLVLQIGLSHEARYPAPAGIKISCPDPNHVSIHGADKRQVGQVAAEIRALRPPEPYKGKGIKYVEEVVRRKEGKKK